MISSIGYFTDRDGFKRVSYYDGEVTAVLYQHGMLDEESDYRIHVCAGIERVYGFETRFARDVIAQGRYELKPVKKFGKITALGYPIPPEELRAIEVPIEKIWWEDERVSIKHDDKLTMMGRKCEQLTAYALNNGCLPFCEGICSGEPPKYREANKEEQMKGWDFLVFQSSRQPETKVEVKGDYPGGARILGGTGNLFLQIAECRVPDEFK